ncbi:MAG: type II toxin-antitoxin system VapC family toxin [Gemmataceae bacterium]|nr:type II toxin-antitoxin system VapC family toxin [Gemmataceae bacterium]
MTTVYFDASALSKRYVRERGSAEVDPIFARVPPHRMRVPAVGTGEVVSVLVRRRNARTLSPAAYTVAQAQFRAEILFGPAVVKTPADEAVVDRSVAFNEQYSVNATDALILRTALDLKAVLAPAGGDVLLVASDRQLLTAATAEGLPTFDPERPPAADFDAAFTA